MLIKVLGSAAGGGFPQVNCNCRNCAGVRQGAPGLTPRTQSSLAVSRDGRAWALLNASPDLRQQLAAAPELAPHADAGARSSPIQAVVLTNGDVDHIAGLLSLREGVAFTLYATERVLGALAANSVFDVLDRRVVPRVPLPIGEPVDLSALGASLGLPRSLPWPLPWIDGRSLPGARQDCPLPRGCRGRQRLRHARGRHRRARDPRPGRRHRLLLHPRLRRRGRRPLARRLAGAALVFFDGTLYADDEMIAQGLSTKTGERMGHIGMSGRDGSIAAFRSLDVKRRIFVHINNSNPVLREDSPERAEVEAAGWEIAFDGMEIRL